jgi:hypothetical protein
MDVTAEMWSRVRGRERQCFCDIRSCSRGHVHSIVFFSCVEYVNGATEKRDAK